MERLHNRISIKGQRLKLQQVQRSVAAGVEDAVRRSCELGESVRTQAAEREAVKAAVASGAEAVARVEGMLSHRLLEEEGRHATERDERADRGKYTPFFAV